MIDGFEEEATLLAMILVPGNDGALSVTREYLGSATSLNVSILHLRISAMTSECPLQLEGKGFKDAFAKLRAARGRVQPNSGFAKQLVGWIVF